jgi:signal transduction histidine kinase
VSDIKLAMTRTPAEFADINHAIETTLLVARNEYKYHACVETEPGELPAVVCNVNELNQVFLNLIINAAHAIARSIIVEKHAGTITVDSEVGNGTKMTLRLPTAGRKGSPGK